MNTFPYAKAIANLMLDLRAEYSVTLNGVGYFGDGEFLVDLISHEDVITDFHKN